MNYYPTYIMKVSTIMNIIFIQIMSCTQIICVVQPSNYNVQLVTQVIKYNKHTSITNTFFHSIVVKS